MVKEFRGLLFPAIMGLALLSGCLFSPEKRPPSKPPPVEYPRATTPGLALTYMITAYTQRDSARTDSIYATGYTGKATDLTGTPVTYSTTKADEVRHVGYLKLDPNIVSIALDFGPERTWIPDSPLSSDPQEWRVLHINAAKIEIQDIASQRTWRASSNPMDYTFIPTYHPATQDTTWKIIRWTELRN